MERLSEDEPSKSPSGRALTFVTLTALYFAQGLPFGFFAIAVPVLLRRAGVSLEKVGLSSLLALPWSAKFLWAPLGDRISPGRFGRRKKLIVPMQLGASAVLLGISLVPPSASRITVLLAGFFLVSAMSATQDIGTDGLALDLLAPADRGLANGIQVGAYRVGMIAGGGGILYVLASRGFADGFRLMALLTIATTIPVLLIRERATSSTATGAAPPRSTSFLAPLVSFVRRPGAGRLVAILVVYKLGDALAVGMMKPFFVDLGFSDGWIALVRGTLGGAAAAIGALAAGALLDRLGRKRAMIGFAVLHALAILAYAVVAARGAPARAIVALVVIEHLVGSASTGALFAWMMEHCRADHRASDYTVQSCIVATVTGVGLAASGLIAGRFGYAAHFAVTGAIALAAAVGVGVLWIAHSRQQLRR